MLIAWFIKFKFIKFQKIFISVQASPVP